MYAANLLETRLFFENLPKYFVLIGILALPFSTTLTQVFILTSVVLGLYHRSYRQRIYFFLNNKVARAIVLFYSCFLIGALYSEATSPEIFSMIKKMSKLTLTLFLMPFFVSVLNRFRAIKFFLIGTLVMISLAIYYQDCAFTKDSLYTSVLVAFSGFLLLHYMFETVQKQLKVFYGLLFSLVAFYALFYNTGRSGFVLFVFLILLCAFQTGGIQRLLKVIIYASVLLGICVAIPSTQVHRRLEITLEKARQFNRHDISQKTMDSSSLGARFILWEQSAKLFLKKPFLGYGTGSFQKVFHKQTAQYDLKPVANPHHEYLNVLVQLGLFGFLVMVWMFFTIFSQAKSLPVFEKHIVQGLLVLMILGCFANSWLMDFLTGYLFVLFLSICFSATYPSRDKI